MTWARNRPSGVCPDSRSTASTRAGSWFQRTRDKPSHSIRTCLREPTHTVEQCVASHPDLFFS